jgi:alpha-beta hydrolase superfamily lysophospholipase
MAFKGGRLELLVPHVLRGQLLRPGFVRLSLRLGAARQMPPWAKLQFIHTGVSPDDLEAVLGRIKSLSSWVEEWQSLGRHHETRGQDAQAAGDLPQAAREYLAASAAYNIAQHVVFMDVNHKRLLHEACVRVYALAAPLFDPPVVPFEVPFRRRLMKGYLRVPARHPDNGRVGVPLVVMFNGTNAVKEELHWWGQALLEQGLAVIAFDGPGLGETFHRMSMVGEPRPVIEAVLGAVEAHPELDISRVGLLGLSLGGYIGIRMAAHDPRIRAVAAISPPYELGVYWNITLAGMRRELAALYAIDEREMGAQIERLTLAGAMDTLRCPLMVAAGGHDHLTPGREAWHIFEDARCERELVFYPRGGHECFNVLTDLRPRICRWLARNVAGANGAQAAAPEASLEAPDFAPTAAEAVDADFADALNGEVPRPVWNRIESAGVPVRWRWPWGRYDGERIEIVHRVEHAALERA